MAISPRIGGPASGGPPPWLSNNLLAIASAAVLTIYSAGYARTRAAADRFDVTSERRPARPAGAERPALDAHEPSSPATLPARAEPDPVPRSAVPSAVGATVAVPTPTNPGSPAPGVTTEPLKASTGMRAVDPVPDKPVAVAVDPIVTPPVSTPTAPLPAPASAATTTVASVASSTAQQLTDSAAATVQKDHGLKDGVFSGWGSSRHGDIQATVEVRGGRIFSATITQCQTRYPCSRIAILPPQVVARQSSNVDFVSRATDSTNAFYYAVVDALSKAK